MIELTIPGLPVGKSRHRHGKHGTYSTQTEVERGVVWEIKRQIADFTPTDRPLELRVDAYFPRPKSHYGTGKNSGVIKPSAPTLHTKKPDIDNIVKFYMDCMNKVVYLDDCQVVELTGAAKRWVGKDDTGYVKIVLKTA